MTKYESKEYESEMRLTKYESKHFEDFTAEAVEIAKLNMKEIICSQLATHHQKDL